MIKFLLKKSFYDGWDNLFVLALSNLIPAGLLFGLLMWDSVFALPVILLLLTVYIAGMSGVTYNWSNYGGKWFEGFIASIKKRPKHIAVFFLAVLFLLLCANWVIPFYWRLGNMMGLAVCIALLCAEIIVFTAMLFYFPLSVYMEKDGALKTLKKCFLILIDNFGFCFFCLLRTAFDLALSVLTAGLLPGFSGINLGLTDAVKLLMIKYDYLESKKISKQEIKVSEMLADEKQLFGKRNLRSLFTPGK